MVTPPPFSVPTWTVTASRKTLPLPISSLRAGALVFLVLRGAADDGVGEEDVVAADGRVAEDRDAVEQPAAGADLHVRADHAERADLDVVGDLGLLVDDRVRARSSACSSEKKRNLNR